MYNGKFKYIHQRVEIDISRPPPSRGISNSRPKCFVKNQVHMISHRYAVRNESAKDKVGMNCLCGL